jgi:LAO/AO transport system kinase
MLALGVPTLRSGSWRPPVLKICGLSGDGVAALRETIDAHRAALEDSGAIVARRAEINERRLLLASEDAVRKSFFRQRDGHVAGILRELNERRISPHTAAKQLLEKLHQEDRR